ncbi:MAG: hypothetical protein ACOYM5_16435 [Caulobacter sp.]
MVSMVVWVASLFSVLLFLGCVWLSRAGYWRTAAALMGGMAAAGLRFGVDMTVFHFDWWTFGDTSYAPVVTYAPVMFWFGGGLGLIGWRMIRNWGAGGELGFFAGFVALGLGRDLLLTMGAGALTFGEGPWPLVIAAGSWLVMAVLVQLTMQLLVGPIDADALAPERIPQIEEDPDTVWS